MFSELTNILPPEFTAAFRKAYYVRLAVVVLVALAIIVIINAILLAPAFFSATQKLSIEQQTLDQLTKSSITTEEADVNTRLSNLSSEANYLVALKDQPAASAAIRALLDVPHPGIVLTGFTYAAPAKKGSDGTLELTGVADTREDLRSYDGALGNLPFVTSADLPISAYAEAANIHFTITLTGSLKP